MIVRAPKFDGVHPPFSSLPQAKELAMSSIALKIRKAINNFIFD